MNIFQCAGIANNGDFQTRIRYLMVKAAVSQLNAANPAAEDKLLGQRILDGTEPVVMWATAVMSNATIAAGAHDADGKTIIDDTLEFVVNSLWDAFAI